MKAEGAGGPTPFPKCSVILRSCPSNSKNERGQGREGEGRRRKGRGVPAHFRNLVGFFEVVHHILRMNGGGEAHAPKWYSLSWMVLVTTTECTTARPAPLRAHSPSEWLIRATHSMRSALATVIHHEIAARFPTLRTDPRRPTTTDDESHATNAPRLSHDEGRTSIGDETSMASPPAFGIATASAPQPQCRRTRQ